MDSHGTVLVVDDNEQIRELAEDILEDAGFHVVLATNGEEGLEMAKDHKPDVILLDRMMPGMSGDELCKILKADNELKRSKIVILSARASTQDKVAGLSFGADDYLTKPYQPEELVARVKVHCNTKTAEDALQKAKEDTETLLHVLCHDLVNPLTAIDMMVELAQRLSGQEVEESNELWKKVKTATLQIIDIIDHVREMRALESGKKKIELMPVPLADVLEAVNSNFQSKLAEKEIQLNIHTDQSEAPYYVMAEPVSLTHNVVSNLISNGIKFSYRGSQINVTVKPAGDSVHIEVTDHGIGMPPELANSIFRPEEPTTRRGTEKEKGTGFGMPLVKKYVDLYGGRIDIESRAEQDSPDSHGTAVHLYLRKA